ncbi:Mic1 domain-containing protein [Aphelenchoides fujianensis]|nr:Mic1 domain-containing protein [Aphelenchoides fujianensis]
MLRLGDEFVPFEVSSNCSDTFYDAVNQKICTVRSNGAMGISAKGFNKSEQISFRIRDAGPISTLNFSTDGRIASIHRGRNAVHFVFLEEGAADRSEKVNDYKLSTDSADFKIIGLYWINDKQIAYVTDQGLCLYQLNTSKKSLKLIKNIWFNPSWCVCYAPSQLLLCASGVTSGRLHPFLIQNGVIHKLSPFEADFGCSRSKPRLCERDVTVASIYNKLYVLVLKAGSEAKTVERVNLYLMNNDASVPPKLAHSLRLPNLQEPVGVHVIDNVVIVHHQVLPNLRSVYDSDRVEIYTQTWAICPPNFIVDIRFGVFMNVQLVCEKAANFIEDHIRLLNFIANRFNSADIFLETLKNLLFKKELNTKTAAEIFGRIVRQPGTAHITLRDSNFKYRLVTIPFDPLRVDYSLIVRSVLVPLKETEGMDMKFLASLALELIRVLRQANIPLQDEYIAELLIHALVDAGEIPKLKQLLQYRVIDDSKGSRLRTWVVSGSRCPSSAKSPSTSCRRHEKLEQIAEIRMEQGRVIEALRCLRDSPIDRAFCLRLLKAAWQSESRQVKYTIYTALRDVRKLPFFDAAAADEQFDRYAREFRALFNVEEVEEAERRFRLAEISGPHSSTAPSASGVSVDDSRRGSLDESLDTESVYSDFDQNVDASGVAPGGGPPQ